MKNNPEGIHKQEEIIKRTRKILPAGQMPVVGLGTWQLTGATCRSVVSQAIKNNYRHIDTAEMYGNEEEVGEGIKEADVPREKLFVTSKVWRDNLSEDKLIQSCEKSLEKLDTYYLDLYLVHWPNKDISLDETFKAMKELMGKGKVKAIGVSNFTKKHLEEAIAKAKSYGLKIAVNQVEFHPFLFQSDLLDFCKENDIQLVAYSPLARGEVLANDVLKTIGETHDKNEAQVVLRWALQKGVVVIPKSSSEEHLLANLDVFDFNLSDEEMEKIDSLNEDKRLVNPPFAEF